MFCNELNNACVYACSYNLWELCILPCPSSYNYIQVLKVYMCSVYIYLCACKYCIHVCSVLVTM